MITAIAIGAEFPEAEIASSAVGVKLYLPDAAKGYYRGTRFDWSGVIYSLRTNGHEYFGEWFDKYDPKLHDAIQGPVEEFLSPDGGLGYAEAAPGGTFIRIGVGAVRKPEEKEYQRFRTYEIVDPGKWTIDKGKDRIEFVHELKHDGYGYRYVKTIRLANDKPEMVIEHSLRNTGTKPIPTMQYNHNFFVLDKQPTGPDASVTFPFQLEPKTPFKPDMAEVSGKRVVYKRELQKGESVFTELEGFGSSASDYDVRVEHKKAGAGVRIVGDKPISKIVYWSIRTTLCPEAYVKLDVAPGEETKWKYTYSFYEMK